MTDTENNTPENVPEEYGGIGASYVAYGLVAREVRV